MAAGAHSQDESALPLYIAMSGFSGAVLAFVAFRGVAWALWSPERSRLVLSQSGLTEANVLNGKFGRLWQWFLDVDKEGRSRDA
jgi:hypothetical protein